MVEDVETQLDLGFGSEGSKISSLKQCNVTDSLEEDYESQVQIHAKRLANRRGNVHDVEQEDKENSSSTLNVHNTFDSRRTSDGTGTENFI